MARLHVSGKSKARLHVSGKSKARLHVSGKSKARLLVSGYLSKLLAKLSNARLLVQVEAACQG
jgi:hypothetical protein